MKAKALSARIVVEWTLVNRTRALQKESLRQKELKFMVCIGILVSLFGGVVGQSPLSRDKKNYSLVY